MLIQVLGALVADREAVRERAHQAATAAPGLQWLTGGLTDDGQFIAVARFQEGSPGAWWADLEACLAEPLVVRDSSDIEVILGDRTPDAGFLEVIEGHTSDRARFMHLQRELEYAFSAERPDFLGSLILWWSDGAWMELASFTSADDVRAGDAAPLPPRVEELVAAWEVVAGRSSQLDIAGLLFFGP
jgi:hypothetical protein